MNRCVLTICVLAYNVENYLHQTLESVIQKDEIGKYEVLIVNDGSKDKTPEIAMHYVNMYPEIFTLIDKENGGVGSGFNIGIEHAKGKYFRELDGDDLLDKENLSEFIQFLNESNSDLIIAPFHSFDDKSGEILGRKSYPELAGIGRNTQYSSIAKYYPWMEMHAACVKTSLLKEHSIVLQEKCFYVDVEYMVKTCSYVETVSFFNKDLYCYRLSRDGQSMSIEGLKKHYLEHERICLILAKHCAEVQCGEEIKKAIYNRTAGMIDNQYTIFFSLESNHDIPSQMKQFDKELKAINPKLYAMNKSKKVAILRATNFMSYNILKKVTDNK